MLATLFAAASSAAGHAASHDEHGADYGEAAGLPQLDFSTWPGQIFWLAIAFGILYLVLSRSLLPRVGGVIEDRRDKIEDDLDEAARLRRQAEQAEQAYEQALADARARAHAIAAEARERLNAEIAAETDAAEAAFAEKAAEAETRIRAAADAAMANVAQVANEAAAAIVEKLTGSAPSAGDVSSAVERAERSS